MKGRDTIDDLQHFLNSVISKCFSIKYTLYLKQRENVRNQQDLTLWKLYHSQQQYFPTRKFITEGDISNYTKKLIDKKASSRIVMLRHIQILQEIRKNSTTFYIWLQALWIRTILFDLLRLILPYQYSGYIALNIILSMFLLCCQYDRVYKIILDCNIETFKINYKKIKQHPIYHFAKL